MVERKRGRWEEREFNRKLVRGYVAGHPGNSFGIKDILKGTGLHISLTTCYRIMDELKEEGLVKQLTPPHKQRKYCSLISLPPSSPIVQEKDEDDDLGKQARESYYDDTKRYGSSRYLHHVSQKF